MNESDYWARLEYRVCHELDGLRRTVARPYWCDGFSPTRYILNGPSPRILGRAWMGVGHRHQEQWEFTLMLGRPFASPEDIDWPALLPPPDATRWLTVEPDHKHLTIEPSAAVPDA
jgi:hypothetical protein